VKRGQAQGDQDRREDHPGGRAAHAGHARDPEPDGDRAGEADQEPGRPQCSATSGWASNHRLTIV